MLDLHSKLSTAALFFSELQKVVVSFIINLFQVILISFRQKLSINSLFITIFCDVGLMQAVTGNSWHLHKASLFSSSMTDSLPEK